MENKLLDEALKYATKFGWAVFPVSNKTKKPLTPHGCKDAKKTPGPIKAWWKKWPDANIGVATGSLSNLVVIDLDIDEDKGLDGVHEMTIWENDNGDLPETARAITGRGGSHIYFHYEGSDLKNRTGISDGVDVRGEGGYVIAPPSIHPNGTVYEWECDPDEVSVAEVNEQVKKFLSIGSNIKQANEHFSLPDVINSGQRNTTMHKMACSLQSQGF
ncbi:MAG: bifunctional DNA primase/polymerase, partial [Verrucomicrobia bacterium]|nr:bifunctional DNA primase/polymerase [Verrucomicrobiota bacterium]